jgi:hypothetical protein
MTANPTTRIRSRRRRTRRLRLGQAMHFVLDGPFAETKEVIAGYWSFLACTDCHHASAAAESCPRTRSDL